VWGRVPEPWWDGRNSALITEPKQWREGVSHA
jgi:hypothetical protein